MFFFFMLLSAIWLSAHDKEFKLDEIVVTAGRIPISFSNLGRSVIVLNAEEIKALPVSNITDLLRYINSIDLKMRGFEGVQSDIGIRGGTFEQTLILVDGVKLSDPQTGHHNLNIPVSLENIERIEVLKGQGSKTFGPNAFSGTINIITKKSKKPLLSILTEGGEHKLYNFDISASYPIFSIGNNLSLSKKKSDGYTHNTDFDITQFSFNQNYFIAGNDINLFFGYIDKKFGAKNFYSEYFPNQREHTTTNLFYATSESGFGNVTIVPKIFWRQNDDDYILDYTRPSYYRNTHRTYSYGGEIQSSLKTDFGITTVGMEFGKEEIISSNLGSHTRAKGGFFGEHIVEPISNIFISFGFYLYKYSNIPWKFWPGIDVAFKASDKIKIFANFGKSFRIPTFTELYYTSPANLGNPNLTFEESISYELGLTYFGDIFFWETSVFLKNGRNIIDWTRASKQDPWQAENIGVVRTYGSEFNFSLFPEKILTKAPITKVNFSYTYLNVAHSTGIYESKYLLDNLRHQLIVGIDHRLPFGLQQNWVFIFKDRVNFDPQFTVDTQINANFGKFNFFIRATNIFNKKYMDFVAVVLPGRWITIGIRLHI